nr:hypothetical protein [uncultured Clostridium sp.]
MKNTLVLYESRYGFTKMTAKQAALVLGPGKCRSGFRDMGVDVKQILTFCFPPK